MADEVPTKPVTGGFLIDAEAAPIPALLFCPACDRQHVDTGEWASRPHHVHLCLFCNFTWRVEPYCVGVQVIATNAAQEELELGAVAHGETNA